MYTVYCRYCGALIPKKKAKRRHGHNFCPKKECEKLFFEISERSGEMSKRKKRRIVPISMAIATRKKDGRVSFWKGF